MNEEVMKFVLENHEKYPDRHELHSVVLARFPGIKLGYSTLTKALRKPHWSEKARTERKRPVPPRDQALAADIQERMEASPQISCRQLALQIGKPESTVRSYLHEVLQLEYHKTKWEPHDLTSDEKKIES